MDVADLAKHTSLIRLASLVRLTVLLLVATSATSTTARELVSAVAASLGARTASACWVAAHCCNGLRLFFWLLLLDNCQHLMVGSEGPQLVGLPGQLLEVRVVQMGQHHAQVSWQAA